MVDPEDAIAARVEAAIAACSRSWPGVRVDPRALADRLRATDADPRWHADVCLACACLAGDPAALRAIDGVIAGEARRAARELRVPAWLADDIHQELSQRLLVAPPGATPRLAAYAGQAALGRWLGVAAMRTALNLARRARPAAPLDGDHAASGLLPPDLALVRDRYRDDINRAVRDAFDALDSPRDRNLIRLYYFERVGLDRLGQMFGVHGSTVSRWLTALREAILDDVRARLAERLGVRGAIRDIDSLIRAVHSELDVALSGILTSTSS